MSSPISSPRPRTSSIQAIHSYTDTPIFCATCKKKFFSKVNIQQKNADEKTQVCSQCILKKLKETTAAKYTEKKEASFVSSTPPNAPSTPSSQRRQTK